MHSYLNTNAPQLIVNHCPHEMSIKVLGMFALKSVVQSVDFGGSFLFLALESVVQSVDFGGSFLFLAWFITLNREFQLCTFALKSVVQSVDFGGSFLFLARFIALNREFQL